MPVLSWQAKGGKLKLNGRKLKLLSRNMVSMSLALLVHKAISHGWANTDLVEKKSAQPMKTKK